MEHGTRDQIRMVESSTNQRHAGEPSISARIGTGNTERAPTTAARTTTSGAGAGPAPDVVGFGYHLSSVAMSCP